MSILLTAVSVVLAIIAVLFAVTILPRLVGGLVFRMSKAVSRAPKP